MKSFIRENRGMLAFLLCLGLMRSAFANWYPVPSGSMRPTILEGDVVLVDRVAYDLKLPLTNIIIRRLGEPRRGDVVVFDSPVDGTRLIKRLVAVGGDTVAMRNEQLIINGVPVQYDGVQSVNETTSLGATPAVRGTERLAEHPHGVQFLPLVQARRNFAPIVVPKDTYFFLGDNRDNSADSRYIGVVPRELLTGRAHTILVSADILGNWLPRWSRTGSAIP